MSPEFLCYVPGISMSPEFPPPRKEVLHAMTFDQWFAHYLQQDELQVEHLLRDRTATRFLIAWSLFESRCFEGFAKINKFSAFAKLISEIHDFECLALQEPAKHFHSRYQDKQRCKNLMHDQKSKEMEEILSKEFAELSRYELTLMLLVVVYRFRNNIFHGNKGVRSWLGYKEQISLCLDVMQSFISAATGAHNTPLVPIR